MLLQVIVGSHANYKEIRFTLQAHDCIMEPSWSPSQLEYRDS